MSGIRFGARKINDGWSFAKLPPDSTYVQAGRASWERVDLPHDWLIWQAEDLYESADAWYWRILRPEEMSAPVTILRFDGVYMDCDVMLDGEVLCTHRYGYTAFDVDLSGLGGSRKKHELAVHIRHRSPNSRWYSGSGIYRDVQLISLPESHLVPGSERVATRKRDGFWEIGFQAETAGQEVLKAEILENGCIAASAEADPENGSVRCAMRLDDPREWSPDTPNLYVLRLTYGEEIREMRIGLRETAFHPEKGFALNGVPMKLHGVCLHHDLGALGAAFHEKAARRQLRIMKEMGVNALRTSHNPPAARMLDLCDEMGILVIDEAFDMWERSKTEFDYARFFREEEEADVARWVRRDRNHPCVIMWSIGNEIYDMHAGPRGEEITRMLAEQVRRNDPEQHAPVTFGCNYMPWEGGQRCADILKLPGYNYGEKLYEAHHRAHPDWVIYGSETASILSSRGIYHFPADREILSDADLQCSSLGNSNTSWGARSLGHCIVDDLNNPFTLGQFIWSGIDYIGEPTPYHTRSCYFGQTDTACFPKDSYYLFQSLWRKEKMIHIGVSWDWNEGQMIDVRVMTSCAEAELILNGRPLGRQPVLPRDPERCLARWRVPFEKGELIAVGYDGNGNELVREVKYTPGETAALRLEAEDTELIGDGEDMTFITVTAEDGEGHPVENARDRIRIRMEGGARLLGVDNGDSTDPEGYKAWTRRLFGGKLLIMLGSNGKKEDVLVEVSTPQGLRAELRLPVRPAALAEGASCLQTIPRGRPDPAERQIPVRRLELIPLEGTVLSPEKPEIAFQWRIHPENAEISGIQWQVTNFSGIPTPAAEAVQDGDRVTVQGKGDGDFYLRALYGNAPDHPEQISQMEIHIHGMGKAGLDPYSFVSAGFFDLQEGDIGAGNEKGIAFSREGRSMIGFSGVDFGKTGTNRLTMPIFALDDKPYLLEMYLGDPRKDGRLLMKLPYQKPSLWNVYQEETWTLPETLRGVQTICFALDRKIHLKGFRFEKQSRAWQSQRANDADSVYGDSFTVCENAILNIGNNVTLVWENMDFGTEREVLLTIDGRTPLDANAITFRMEREDGETETRLISFRGTERGPQTFPFSVPGGNCRISMIFLPGSQFDLYGFRFSRNP